MRYYWGWGISHTYAHEKQDLRGFRDSTMGTAGDGIDDPEDGDLMANEVTYPPSSGGKSNPSATETHPPTDNATSGDKISEEASGDEDKLSDNEENEDSCELEEADSEEEF